LKQDEIYLNEDSERIAGGHMVPGSAVGFGSSTAALRAFLSEPHRFDAVLTDEVMADLQGTELARELRSIRPGVPVIVMSGHAGPHLPERVAAAGVNDLLRKPLQKRDSRKHWKSCYPNRPGRSHETDCGGPPSRRKLDSAGASR
jgi:CheY-like chemotaxis protein